MIPARNSVLSVAALGALHALLAASALNAQVTFRLGETTAAPGETGLSVPLVIEVDPGAQAVEGWTAAIAYDPRVVGAVEVTAARRAEFAVSVAPQDFLDAGRAGFLTVYSLLGDRSRFIPAGGATVAAYLEFCVLESAAPGVYPLDFDFRAERLGEPAVDTLFTAAGWSRRPLLESGTLHVGAGPLAGGGCPADERSVPPQRGGGAVIFQLAEATAAPGETGLSLPVLLLLDSDAPPVEGWTMALSYDPAALGEVVIENTREADFFAFSAAAEFWDPGRVSAAVVYSFSGDTGRFVTAANDGVVADLRFCILASAPPGEYPLDVASSAARREQPPATTLYSSGGRSLTPLHDSGLVVVAGEPVPGGECLPDAVAPRPRPEDLEATFELRSQTDSASRGDVVDLAFIVQSNGDVGGVSYSIDYDEEVLEALAVERLFTMPDGSTDYDFVYSHLDNANNTPGAAGADEGFAVGAFVFSFVEAVVLPRDRENEVLAFELRVRPDAPGGATEIRFLDGGRVPGSPPVENVVAVFGEAVFPSADEITRVFINARMEIVGELILFRRGDADSDGERNLTDAVFVFRGLFAGGPIPPCRDAADIDDSGTMNLTDGIYLLNSLFRDGPRPPAPFADCGEDPTSDALGCESYEPCR